MDYIPHLALPIRFGNGSFVANEQDSNIEAAHCVQAILSFAHFTRSEDIDFGVEDPTFQTQPIDIEGIAQAISTYEPRVDATIETIDKPDGTTTVKVTVALPASEDMEG